MAESLRDKQVGAGMLAYLALTNDEPPEVALEFMRTAYDRLAWALQTLGNQACGSDLRREAERELAQLSLFLLGVSMAADPAHRTPVSLRLVRRRGRPKRNVIEVGKYRRASRFILDHKAEGYLSAALEAAKKFGVDRSEAQAWASHMEREPETFAQFSDRMKFYRQTRGLFEAGEEGDQRIYRIAVEVLSRSRDGADLSSEISRAASETGLDEGTIRKWLREIDFHRQLAPPK